MDKKTKYGWHHPPAYPVWDKQIMRAMLRQHGAPKAKVVYVENGGGRAAVVMCNVNHNPRLPRSTVKGCTYAYVRGDARHLRRELMRYACLLAEDVAGSGCNGPDDNNMRCRWEVYGPPVLADVLAVERYAVVSERAAWLRLQKGKNNDSWKEKGHVVIWSTRQNSTTVSILPAKSVGIEVSTCETDDVVIVAPATTFVMNMMRKEA